VFLCLFHFFEVVHFRFVGGLGWANQNDIIFRITSFQGVGFKKKFDRLFVDSESFAHFFFPTDVTQIFLIILVLEHKILQFVLVLDQLITQILIGFRRVCWQFKTSPLIVIVDLDTGRHGKLVDAS